jgi:hypothetical protein
MRDVTDDQDGSDILSTAPPRRVPFYVTIAVVLACGLIGYGLSLALPLHRASTLSAPAAAVVKPTEPAKGAEATPARQDASYASAGGSAAAPARETSAAAKTATPTADKPAAAAAALAPPSKLGRGEPTAAAPIAKTSAPAPVPAVETGSVEHAPQRATLPAGDKTAARPPEGQEAARVEPSSADQQPVTKRADGAPRKRVRRVYRPRAQPKTAKGPFETLFPALAK